jgi:DNA-binding response OmpR family regulator
MSDEARETPLMVLVIEDDDSLRTVISYSLRRNGYQVLEAGDGAVGLEAARQAGSALDSVILDYMLPGQNGMQVIRQIRAEPTMSDVAILMISARPDDETRSAAMAAGAYAFLRKPFRMDDLLAQLQAALVDRQE